MTISPIDMLILVNQRPYISGYGDVYIVVGLVRDAIERIKDDIL